jgi:hypothetical protein
VLPLTVELPQRQRTGVEDPAAEARSSGGFAVLDREPFDGGVAAPDVCDVAPAITKTLLAVAVYGQPPTSGAHYPHIHGLVRGVVLDEEAACCGSQHYPSAAEARGEPYGVAHSVVVGLVYGLL